MNRRGLGGVGIFATRWDGSLVTFFGPWALSYVRLWVGVAPKVRSSMFLELPGIIKLGPCVEGVISKNGHYTGVSYRFWVIKGGMG